MSDLREQPDETGQARPSTRDPAESRQGLASWLTRRLGHEVVISGLAHPTGNGLSSETLIFDAEWAGGRAGYVARMAPPAGSVPVFPSYDLGRQFEVMRLVRDRAGIPAPRALGYEPDPGPLGSPFFVMERLAGRIPADLPPYTMQGWLLDASPGERAELQSGTVRTLARLHDAPFAPAELGLLRLGGPGESTLRRHLNDQRAYYEWAHGALRLPVLEAAFDWVAEHWPAEPGGDVLCWGDARIGNVIYQGFSPAAVLDWEMAALGPRELDLGWMIFLHRFFQDVAEVLGAPGLPDFMRREDVCRTYRDLTGYEPKNMEFYEMYAALRHGIIMARIWQRRIHFGELEMPEDPDDLIIHRAAIERMLDGSYWN